MEQSPSLEDCLKLLQGERDEQRLAGLLLVTKFCSREDHASIRRVYDAVGVRFLDRLLRTGMGKATVRGDQGHNQDAYLQLSVTVLAAFCRIPEIASSKDMVSKIPLVLEIMRKESASSFLEECYEFLLLVSTSCEDGVASLYESGGVNVLASQMSTLRSGCHTMELALRLAQLILSKMSRESINNEYPLELSKMVAAVAREFALLHNALKFEALHLLSAILSSEHSSPVHEALRLMSDNMWSTYIRVGIVAILQNRVAPAEKLQALILAESSISIIGDQWLIGPMTISHGQEPQDPIPADRCLLLVSESARVEIAVLLNELAYLKYEASKDTSCTAENILSKQQNLAIAFSLVEKIIKLISNISGGEGSSISESTFIKVISGIDETIGVVLEYIQDAKDHGQNKGDDLLASVRIIGSYLAETPTACEEKVKGLLSYMLTIEGEGESSPFYAICFLFPMLCQITMKVEGCKILASSGGYRAVVECLIKLIGPHDHLVEDKGGIFLACDTVMNLLLKREQIRIRLDEPIFVHLLKALAHWTEVTSDPTVLLMAGSICSLIFDATSEAALLSHPNFELGALNSLNQLILRSLAVGGQGMSDDAKALEDLYQIVAAGYSRWADRFPHIKNFVERELIVFDK